MAEPTATAASSRALGIAAAVIIVITAAFCTVFCLTVRGPWWGIALDCAAETGCALYAWWLIWRTTTKESHCEDRL